MTKGFTLIEVVIVTGIIVLMSGFIIQNFSQSRADLQQSRLVLQDALREAQSLALAGATHGGVYRCGYGVHVTATGYSIYAGPDSSMLDCTAQDRSYTAGVDQIVRTVSFSPNTLEIVLPAVVQDIFFEPPDPVTYLCTSSPCGASAQSTGVTTDIQMRRIDATCPSSDCASIHVTTSGFITAQ